MKLCQSDTLTNWPPELDLDGSANQEAKFITREPIRLQTVKGPRKIITPPAFFGVMVICVRLQDFEKVTGVMVVVRVGDGSDGDGGVR